MFSKKNKIKNKKEATNTLVGGYLSSLRLNCLILYKEILVSEREKNRIESNIKKKYKRFQI